MDRLQQIFSDLDGVSIVLACALLLLATVFVFLSGIIGGYCPDCLPARYSV